MTDIYYPNREISLVQLQKCFDEIETQLKFLSNYHTFINYWKSTVSRNYYNRNDSSYDTEEDISQVFYKDIHLGPIPICLRFKISKLQEKFRNVKPKMVDIKRFGQEDIFPNILYTEEQEYPESYKSDNVPIIAVPLCFGNNSLGFVVDGNHHLSAKIASGHNKILAHLVDVPTASSAILNPFEKSIYCFIQDIDTLNKMRDKNPALSHYDSQLYHLCFQ